MAEKMLKFTVKLQSEAGSSAAWLDAPFDVQETFGTKARVPVRGTINGFPFRSSLMPMGGCHGMAVNKTMREGGNCKAGDKVKVQMQRDTEERVVETPPGLTKELGRHKQAKANWEKLAFTHKKEMAKYIAEAKRAETKKRRLAKVVEVLKNGIKWT
jgi:hypothetical protein